MGGNALTIPTVRYNKKEFFELIPIIKNKLSAIFNSNNIYITKSYEDKPSFGDMDILIKKSSEFDNLNVHDKINELFNPIEIVKNGSVYSFDFNKFQIDLIFIKDEDWETSKVYYSYNDLGNLIGRIANKKGLKYGHFGLAYKHIHKGKGFGDILISKDLEYIFKFLGFSWEEYKKGFKTLEDVFQYVINSRYFNSQIFSYENLNHANRTRNKKRKTYQLFLEYLEKNKDSIKCPTEFNITLKDVDIFFNTNLIEFIEKWNLKIEKQEKANKKFNGNHIINKYSFQGKELGEKLNKFKSIFLNKDAYSEFILNTPLNEIYRKFEYANKIFDKNVKHIVL